MLPPQWVRASLVGFMAYAGSMRPSRHGGRRVVSRAARASVESLERRHLLAVVINEFLANNNSGILDQDGDRSDWIELRNTSASPANIGGWYLTDDAAILTK